MNNRNILLVLIYVFLFAGCSSKLATSKYHSDYNFSLIESYSTYERNSEFDDFQSMSSALRNSIEIAIENALNRKGLQYKLNKNADVIIGYHLINKRDELMNYNEGVKYCELCLNGGLPVKSQKSWGMVPDSLILDMVHQKNKRSIWRSVYPLKLKIKDNSHEVQEKIKQAIALMMNTLPKVAI